MEKLNKQIWIWSLLFLFAVTVYYDYGAVNSIRNYNSFTEQTQGVITQFEVANPFTDYFYLDVEYVYTFEGTQHRGEQRLEGMLIRNRFSAEKEGKKLIDQTVPVWVDPARPSLGIIERNYPLRDAVYAAILTILTAYWFGLGLYVAKISR